MSEARTNNEAEYEALIAGLELCIQLGIQSVRVMGDSQLIINQVAGSFKILKPSLIPYHQRVMALLEQIPDVILSRVPRSDNGRADALAKLAKEMAVPQDQTVTVTVQSRLVLSPASLEHSDVSLIVPEPGQATFSVDQGSDWRQPFIEYLHRGVLPSEKSLAAQIRKRAVSYAYIDDVLYRRFL